MRLPFLLAVAACASTACLWPQTEECRRFVECQNAVDPDVDTSGFEPDGICWRNLSTSVRCTEMCAAALEALAELPDAPDACEQG